MCIHTHIYKSLLLWTEICTDNRLEISKQYWSCVLRLRFNLYWKNISLMIKISQVILRNSKCCRMWVCAHPFSAFILGA